MSVATVTVEIGDYRVGAAADFGPRVTDLRLGESPNLLAVLEDDVAIEHPTGLFRFRGGHRLWAAREVPAITYAPDDHACSVENLARAIVITGPPDAAGLAKRITVAGEDGMLRVDHAIENLGDSTLEIAPWSITQFPLGGLALLPLGGTTSPGNLQASGRLVTWPYTSLIDPRLRWRDAGVTIEARQGPALKMGSGPSPRHLGYLREGWLFTKQIPRAQPGEYPDHGAVGQVFTGESFCELESVGPLTLLEPGRSVWHREHWVVAPCDGEEEAWSILEDA